MHLLKLVSFFLLSVILFSSCKKENESPIVLPPATFEVPATEDIVMYEINTPAFSTTKNLQGIIDRLDSIKALGINTIWLMPIYPVGILNAFGSPYCVMNYTDVNASFGTIGDLKNLVTEAHKKNIAVILDWVANHTSWDNAWIANKDWYTQDANGNIIHPAGTNWNDVADLNYDNDTMRLAMIAAMKFWIDTAAIDGFRCDAADFVPFDFWQQAIDSLHNIPNKQLILLAEGARNDHFTAGFQMNYSWNFLTALKNVFNLNHNVSELYSTNTSEYAAVPTGDKKLRFTTNHDESNMATPTYVFTNNDGALAASVITIFLQGVPLIYCGQEVGVNNPAVYNGGTINWTLNPLMLTAYKQLLGFYNTSGAARKGDLITYTDFNIACFKKSLGNEKLLVIVNTKATDNSFAVPVDVKGNWVNAFDNSAITLTDTLALPAFDYLVLKN